MALNARSSSLAKLIQEGATELSPSLPAIIPRVSVAPITQAVAAGSGGSGIIGGVLGGLTLGVLGSGEAVKQPGDSQTGETAIQKFDTATNVKPKTNDIGDVGIKAQARSDARANSKVQSRDTGAANSGGSDAGADGRTPKPKLQQTFGSI